MPLLFRRIKILILLFALVVGFQNCSNPRARFSSQERGEQLHSVEGNGGTYDGKPRAGTYVRRHPAGCTDSVNVIGLMSVGPEDLRVNSDVCVPMDYAVGFADSRVEYATYNPDLIGLNAAVFEFTTDASRGPNVELWCRHRSGDFGLDVVVRSEAAVVQAMLYIGESLTTASPRSRMTNPVPVTNSRQGQALVVNSAQGEISTQVDLKSSNAGVYSGRAQVRLDNKVLDLAVECRVLSAEPAVHVAPDQLLAIYQLNGGSVSNGSVVENASSYSPRALLSNADGAGAAYGGGVFDASLAFDGRNDYVDLQGLAALTGSESTVVFWARPDATIDDDSVAFSVIDSLGENVVKIGNGLCTGTGDRLNLSLELDDTCFDTGRTFVDGAWHMIAVVISGGQAALYLDGVEVRRETLLRSLSATDQWSLGRDLDAASSNDFYEGQIDEALVWKSVLTPAQISVTSQTGRP